MPRNLSLKWPGANDRRIMRATSDALLSIGVLTFCSVVLTHAVRTGLRGKTGDWAMAENKFDRKITVILAFISLAAIATGGALKLILVLM
jgi:hypothetical protein